jgi:hypothetical protein
VTRPHVFTPGHRHPRFCDTCSGPRAAACHIQYRLRTADGRWSEATEDDVRAAVATGDLVQLEVR